MLQHLNKNNLHHAYLIEGNKDEILPEVFSFFEDMGVKTSGNPDFYNIALDTFKMEDAENLKSSANQKSFSATKDAKRIFIISANNFLHNAQNTLLKIFEEPNEDTHFFVIVPDVSVLLKTLVSRFYFISARSGIDEELKTADKFIKMNLSARLDFLKELLKGKEESEEDKNEEISTDSPRAKANRFLNALEVSVSKTEEPHPGPLLIKERVKAIEQIFKVREFLRQPGSSAKMLMESVAIIL